MITSITLRLMVVSFRKSPRPSLLIKRAALGNLKASFHCTHWHRFFPLKKAFSKTYPSFLTLKEGSTFLTKPLFNSLYAPFGSPSSGGQKPSGTRGCNRPTVLFSTSPSLLQGELHILTKPSLLEKGRM